jgi:site-specific DNA-methyltransferase (adenine-specific)
MKSDIQLIHGDCLEKLKDIPDNSIDLVVSDPPYGKMGHLNHWDNVIKFDLLWPELRRIAKDKAAILLFAQQPFASHLVLSNLSQYRCEWIWDKHIARGMHTAKYQPMGRHESILVFGNQNLNYYPIMVERDKPIKRKCYTKNKTHFYGENDGEYRTYTHINPDTIIRGCWEANRGKIHPTQKPVSLMEYLIKTYSKEGETVLDFCTGSNSSGVAAFYTNRNFIGIEKDETYFNLGKERLIKLGVDL